MDVEFVNLFIAKQKAMIDELNNKLLMSETRIQILSNLLDNTRKENEDLNQELEKAKAKKKTE